MTTLEELEKLLKAGTPGKWSVTDEREILSVETRNDPIDGETYEERTLIVHGECSQNWGYIEWFNLADAALIVAAINALPGLIESAKENAILKRLAPEYFRWTGGPDQTEDPEWICVKLKYGGAEFENVCTPDVRLVVYDDQDRRHVAKPGDYIVKGDNGLWVLPALLKGT